VAERPAAGVQLLLELGAEDARLHAREARGLVDGQHPVEPAHVHRDDGAPLARRGLERARDVRAAAEGDDDGVRRQRGLHDRHDGRLVARAHHDVRQAAHVAAPVADEVAQALAAGVLEPLEVIRGEMLVPDRRGEGRAQRVRQRRRRELELAERRRARRGAADVDHQVALEERPERRLVRMRECDAVVAPTPPLHPDDLIARGGRGPP
jgi:hypothetical protein